MTCPSCGLESPASATYCDCGYDFKSQRKAARRSIQSGPIWQVCTPTRVRLVVALFCAVLLGAGGAFLFWTSSCWFGGNDCAAYSPVGVALAYAMSWPIIMISQLKVAQAYFWCIVGPLQLAYYYVVVTLISAVIGTIRSSRRP